MKIAKKIILLPVYNESRTLDVVLEKLKPHADIIVAINDGSSDSSGDILARWANENRNFKFIDLRENQGKSYAMEIGFRKILEMEKEGLVGEDDMIVATDADGQLPPEIIEDACIYFHEKGLDMLIGSRDFTPYPLIKRLGNYFLTFIASLLTGFPFRDTQCGFRIFRVEAVEEILKYYRARKYTCEQELSMIGALLGLKLDNSFTVHTAYYRSNSTYADALQITIDSFKARMRVKKSPGKPAPDAKSL